MFKFFAPQTVDGILESITKQVVALEQLSTRRLVDMDEALNKVEIFRQLAQSHKGESIRALRIHDKLNELIS